MSGHLILSFTKPIPHEMLLHKKQASYQCWITVVSKMLHILLLCNNNKDHHTQCKVPHVLVAFQIQYVC